MFVSLRILFACFVVGFGLVLFAFGGLNVCLVVMLAVCFDYVYV